MCMVRSVAIVWFASFLLATPLAAQSPERTTPAESDSSVPSAGFWPTPRMMELYIDRLTEEMSDSFGFDDDQLYQTRQLFKERFIPWLNDNRAAIERATNEFIEALLDDEPPDKDFVADWAARTLDLLDQFIEQVEETGAEMRSYTTEEQQVLLDGNLAAFRLGTSATLSRLSDWAAGNFDPVVDWVGSPQYQPPPEPAPVPPLAAGVRPAKPGGAPTPGITPASAPATRPAQIDDWAAYVEDFIRRYQLDDDQQQQAYRMLRSQEQDRDRYLERAAGRLERAENDLRSTNPQQQAAAERILEERNRAIANKFAVLKSRLEKIPTREQRRVAAQKARAELRTGVARRDDQDARAKRESPSSP